MFPYDLDLSITLNAGKLNILPNWKQKSALQLKKSAFSISSWYLLKADRSELNSNWFLRSLSEELSRKTNKEIIKKSSCVILQRHILDTF